MAQAVADSWCVNACGSVVHHNYLTGDLMAQLAKLGWSIETLERLDVYPQNLPAYE